MTTEKHEPIFFNRKCLEASMAEFLDTIDQHLDEKGCTVSFKVGAESRRAIQNRLCQSWKGEIAKFMHVDDFDFQWGEMKLQHLLPLKQVMPDFQDEAQQELDMAQTLAKALRNRLGFVDMSDYERLCRAACICIRSKGLPLMLFARWLDRMQRVYGEQGLRLEAKKANAKALLTDSEIKKFNELEKAA